MTLRHFSSDRQCAAEHGPMVRLYPGRRDNCAMKAISKIWCHDNLLFENPLGDWPEYDFLAKVQKMHLEAAMEEVVQLKSVPRGVKILRSFAVHVKMAL